MNAAYLPCHHRRLSENTNAMSCPPLLSTGKHIDFDPLANILWLATIQAGAIWAPPISCAAWVTRIRLLPIAQDRFFTTPSAYFFFRPEAKQFEQAHLGVLSSQNSALLLLINEDAGPIKASLNNVGLSDLVTLEVNDQRKQAFKLWLPRRGIKGPSSYTTTFVHSLRSRHIEFDSNINVAVRAMIATNTTTE